MKSTKNILISKNIACIKKKDKNKELKYKLP
jgi:hypothetical protein